MTQKQTALEKVVQTLKKHAGEKLRIDDIAKETGLTWYRVYRVVTDVIIGRVANQYFAVGEHIGIVPEITSEGLFFRAQLAEEAA
jgi:hypothetical protein